MDIHIETGQPVGSRSITVLFQDLYRNSYSSATVRNEMGSLEEQGYLTHPHTSAGRVPTDQGYRYYVEFGLRRETLPGNFLRDLSDDLKKVTREQESFAETASQALSNYAQEAGVMLIPVLRQTRGGDASHARMIVSGASRLLEKPEFHNLEKIRDLFRAFEDKEEMIECLTHETSTTRKVHVTIGRENRPEAFRDCAVISADFSLEDGRTGVVAVIGPRRMRYARTITVVERMRDLIEDIWETTER